MLKLGFETLSNKVIKDEKDQLVNDAYDMLVACSLQGMERSRLLEIEHDIQEASEGINNLLEVAECIRTHKYTKSLETYIGETFAKHGITPSVEGVMSKVGQGIKDFFLMIWKWIKKAYNWFIKLFKKENIQKKFDNINKAADIIKSEKNKKSNEHLTSSVESSDIAPQTRQRILDETIKHEFKTFSVSDIFEFIKSNDIVISFIDNNSKLLQEYVIAVVENKLDVNKTTIEADIQKLRNMFEAAEIKKDKIEKEMSKENILSWLDKSSTNSLSKVLVSCIKKTEKSLQDLNKMEYKIASLRDHENTVLSDSIKDIPECIENIKLFEQYVRELIKAIKELLSEINMIYINLSNIEYVYSTLAKSIMQIKQSEDKPSKK